MRFIFTQVNKNDASRLNFSRQSSNILKGVAILMMMVHHCFLSEERFKGFEVDFFPLSASVSIKIAAFFKICVALFVFITAYGLASTTTTASFSRFTLERVSVKRWYKLWMNFLVCFVLGHVFGCLNSFFHLTSVRWDLWTAYGGNGKAAGLVFMLTDALGLADIFGTPSFNGTWWYMSLAIILIFLVPVLSVGYEKTGVVLVVLCALVPQYTGLEKITVVRYLLIIMLGISAAKDQWLYKIKAWIWQSKKRCFLIFILNMLMIFPAVYLRNFVSNSFTAKYIIVFDAVIPLIFVLFTHLFLSEIPVINQMLEFAGRYSMNIFFVHTFIRGFYGRNFIYSLRYAWLICLVLFLLSLILAVLIEKIKDLTGFYDQVDRLWKFLDGKAERYRRKS